MQASRKSKSKTYRDQVPLLSPSEEEFTSSSSSSDVETIQGIIHSPTSDYVVLSVLGEGAFGRVIKCLKTATGETVAVKVIKNSDDTSQAQNEVAKLEDLQAYGADRFNFIRCNNSFIDRQHFCLEFEMLDISLRDFIYRKPPASITLKEIRAVLHQLATTLNFLKNLDMVHTDLKPDNIMMVDHVNQPLKVKLIDFGLARYLSPTHWDPYVQPLAYMAPEVLLGVPYTTAIDMWSLGCIAAEMYSGFMLYSGENEYEILQQVVKTQGKLPKRLLNQGRKTSCFYRKMHRCGRMLWKLKTPQEYGEAADANIESCFSSLDELKKARPTCHLAAEDTSAEMEDLQSFIALLKKMLHLDDSKRITPSELLNDPFLTMNVLAEKYPDSFYVKSSFEMMEICREKTSGSDTWAQQAEVDPQPSTSTANLHLCRQVPPAWHNHQEHPLILGITSAVTKDLFIGSPQKTDVTAPEATARPRRKRTWATFVAAHTALKTVTGSPERKKVKLAPVEATKPQTRKRKRSLPPGSKEASTEAPSSEDEGKPLRKRMKWSLPRQSQEAPTEVITEVEVKPQTRKRKRSLPPEPKEAPTEAPPSEEEGQPPRKRIRWSLPQESQEAPTKVIPEVEIKPQTRKRKRSLPQKSQEAPTEAPSSEVEGKPPRKRVRWGLPQQSEGAEVKPQRPRSSESVEREQVVDPVGTAPRRAGETGVRTKVPSHKKI